MIRRNKGFTLVELVVVIGLLGIALALVAGFYEPLYNVFFRTGRIQEAKQLHLTVARTIREAVRFADVVGVGDSAHLEAGPAESADQREYRVLYIRTGSEEQGVSAGELYRADCDASFSFSKDSGQPVFEEEFYNGMKIGWSFAQQAEAQSDGRATLVITLTLYDRNGVDPLYTGDYPIKLMNISDDTNLNVGSDDNKPLFYCLSYPPVGDEISPPPIS